MKLKKSITFFHKSLIILVLLIGSIFSIQGQGTVLDSEHRYSKILDMLPISANEYVVATKSTYADGTSIKWYKDNSIFKEHILSEDINELKMEVTEEGILVDVSTFMECDIVIPSFRQFLLDTIQNNNFDYHANIVESYANIAGLSNGNILLISGYIGFPGTAERIKLISGDDAILNITVPNDQMTKITEIDNRVFVYGYEYILFTGIDGGEVDTFYFEGNNVINIVKTDVPNQIAVLTWYGVYLKTIGSDEETLYPLALGDGGGKDIIFTDRLYLLRSYEEERNVIEVIDEQGNWEHYASLGLHHYELNKLYDMGPVGDEADQGNRVNQAIWITGQFIFPLPTGYNYYGSAIIQKLDDNSEEENDISLDVINVEGDGEQRVDFTFRVTNNSSNTLEDIKVYSTSLDAVWCSTQNLDFTIDELSSNSDITITTSVGLYFGRFNGTVCVYILGSGENPDLEMEDNITCLQVTKTNELSPINNDAVYPNPVSDVLYLKNMEGLEIIEIINANGQVLLSQRYNNGVHISSLPPGMYYLRKKAEKGEVFKFIKN